MTDTNLTAPDNLPPDGYPAPREGMLLTNLLIVRDVDRSRAFYRDVLGAEVVQDQWPCVMRFLNGWLMINTGGGEPTADKPTVTVEAPDERDANRLTGGLNVRVADVHATYETWRARGAAFLTPPVEFSGEIRCYLRDPDGHLIEVGQKKGKWDDERPAQT